MKKLIFSIALLMGIALPPQLHARDWTKCKYSRAISSEKGFDIASLDRRLKSKETILYYLAFKEYGYSQIIVFEGSRPFLSSSVRIYGASQHDGKKVDVHTNESRKLFIGTLEENAVFLIINGYDQQWAKLEDINVSMEFKCDGRPY